MIIKEFSARNFRNLKTLKITANEKVNVICGENGQGKTNILEGMWLFTGMKSFRFARDRDMVSFGENGYSLSVRFFSAEREQTAALEFSDKKKLTLNGVKEENFKRMGENYKAVLFSPAHLSLIKSGPSVRRDFLDLCLYGIKTGYAKLLNEYERTLSQRNALLKDVRRNPSLILLLEAYDGRIASLGSKIIVQRKKYIENLSPVIKEIFTGISDGKEEITVRYSSFENEGDEKIIADGIYNNLSTLREEDIENFSTSFGPHRDDVIIEVNGKSARMFASQGQQRSCALALKLSEAFLLEKFTKVSPVILLDDVMSELDAKRQEYVFNSIENNQVFITTCEKTGLLKSGGYIFEIKNGEIL